MNPRPTRNPSTRRTRVLTTSVPSGKSHVGASGDDAVDDEPGEARRCRRGRRPRSRPEGSRDRPAPGGRTASRDERCRSPGSRSTPRTRSRARSGGRRASSSSSTCIVENVVKAPQNPVPSKRPAIRRERQPFLQARCEIAEQERSEDVDRRTSPRATRERWRRASGEARRAAARRRPRRRRSPPTRVCPYPARLGMLCPIRLYWLARSRRSCRRSCGRSPRRSWWATARPRKA